MLDDVYNHAILAPAADIPRLGHLADPHGQATAHSRLCGSTVSVEVALQGERVADYAQVVRACALGQASSSIVGRHVVGSTLPELTELRDTVRRMLKEGGPPPSGSWSDVAMLEPVRDYKARHASTLLAFEAVVEAVETALARRAAAAEAAE